MTKPKSHKNRTVKRTSHKPRKHTSKKHQSHKQHGGLRSNAEILEKLGKLETEVANLRSQLAESNEKLMLKTQVDFLKNISDRYLHLDIDKEYDEYSDDDIYSEIRTNFKKIVAEIAGEAAREELNSYIESEREY